jgi:hypothetical protein
MGYILQNLRHVGGGYVNVPLYGPAVDKPTISTTFHEVITGGMMLLILIGLPVLVIVASIVSSRLGTDSVALSNTGKCGRYIFKSQSMGCLVKFQAYERSAETEAAFYALNYYGPSAKFDHSSCFRNGSISYPNGSYVKCPFTGEVCIDEKQPAFRLSTGLVSGSVLGINARNPFLFSRTMTCSPLVNDERYIKLGHSSRGFDQWEYWYGPSKDNYTWSNPVEARYEDSNGYSVRWA